MLRRILFLSPTLTIASAVQLTAQSLAAPLHAPTVVAEATMVTWPDDGRTRLYLPVMLFGHRVSLIVDTGAQMGLWLSPDALAQVGIQPQDTGSPTSLTIGADHDTVASVVSADVYGKLLNDTLPGLARVVGLVGLPVLSHYDLLFDGPKGRLRLYARVPHEASGHSVPDAPLAHPWLPAGLAPTDCQPFDTTASFIHLDVQLNGHRFPAIFDSGPGTTGISAATASLVGITPEAAAAGEISLIVGTRRLTKTVLRERPVDELPGLKSHTVFLSLNAFADRTFFISYSTGQLCVGTPR